MDKSQSSPASAVAGRATALELGRTGAHIVVGELDPANAERTAAEVRGLDRRALAPPTDDTSREDFGRMVEQTRAEFGRIDILVNNAGSIGPRRRSTSPRSIGTLSPASVLDVPQQNRIPIAGGKTQKINDVAVPCQVQDLPSVQPHIEPVAKTRIALPIQSRQVSLQFVLLFCRRQMIVKPGKRCPVHD